mmetsp:Transcript_5771/g.8509  ORF Transcript_5771/g.8509 Transcript_5771/m.8509 type:complete len:228 (-) Transcript_5771:1063-1746(-)
MSSTIFDAACGLPTRAELRLSSSSIDSSCTHSVTALAIFRGFWENAPNSPSRTISTLPASCPGKKLVIMTGRPTAAASAIVPGPAFDTKTSAATMTSAILSTNPRPITSTFPLALEIRSSAILFFLNIFLANFDLFDFLGIKVSQSLELISSLSASFRPQITRIVASTPLAFISTCIFSAIRDNDPTPSPPPMANITFFSGSNPSFTFISLLYCFPSMVVRSIIASD